MVKILIDKGADIKGVENDGRTALFCAALNGHEKVVRYLIEKDADVRVCTIDGWTSLHTAAQNGHVDVVRLLVELRCQGSERIRQNCAFTCRAEWP